VAMFGRAPRGKAILRNRARVGDLVFVSGTLGDSGAGLAALKAKKKQPKLIARYRVPEPRVTLGAKLRGIASAALDVSDGLVADLGHIADTSGVHIVLNARALPLSKAYRAFIGDDPVRAATSGDDYEIAFTAPRGRRAKVIAAAKAARVPVAEIGWVMKGQGVALLDAGGRPIVLRKKGWQHF
ncbi:MAG TPA: AIR synthase-related protein, partial [Bradyrhizobium sp.]